MTTNLQLWLIPLLPLIGAAVNGLLGRSFSKRTVAIIGVGFPGAALAWALVAVSRFLAMPFEKLPYTEYILPWIVAGSFQANIAFYLDQLSLVMLLVVTGVGFLLAMFFAPLVNIVPSEAATPALVFVGFLMMSQVVKKVATTASSPT